MRPLDLLGCFCGVLLLAASASPGLAQPHPDADRPSAASIPHPQEPFAVPPYTVLDRTADRLIAVLPNRLIVAVRRSTAAPVVSVQVWIKTGSIYEQEHTGAGLSHFLEHLLAGGSTANRGEEETKALLGQMGAQTNAATSLDTVRYYINTTRPHAARAIELLSDWMQNSLITEAEYRRERDVIQREFDMGKGEPGRILWKLTQQSLFKHHPARHPTIGYLDEFLTISRDEIYAFYRRMYVPSNMVFVVAGDVDPDAVAGQVAALWKNLPPGDPPTIRLPEEPEPTGTRVVEGVADIDQPILHLAFPGVRMGDEHDYPLDVLAGVLGDGEVSRLVAVVRDRERAVNGISSGNWSPAWGRGYFAIDARVADAGRGRDDEQRRAAVERARALILAEVRRVREHGVSVAEIDRVKRQTIAAVVLAAQTAEGMAGRLASDLLNAGDPDYLQRYRRGIESVTTQEVQAPARRFLGEDRLIAVTLMPKPPEAAIAEPARPGDAVPGPDVPMSEVDLDNRALLEKLARRDPDASVDARPASAGESIRRVVLPNGLRVLVQRSATVPAVTMQWYQLGGLLADDPGREGVASATAAMIRRGTATRTAEQISALTENLGASLDTSAGNNTSFVRVTCLREDWRPLLSLLSELVEKPSFPREEWDKLRPRLVAAIDSQRDTWGGELRSHARTAWYGQHPWSQPTIGRKDVVERLSVEDLKAFHLSRLSASDSVLAIVGDIEPDQVLAAATAEFGDVPSRAPHPYQPKVPPAPAPRVVIESTRKPLAAAAVMYGPGPTITSPDVPAVRVLSRVLSSFPAGWLEEELRGKGPGLVYAVGGGVTLGLAPAHFSVSFNTSPEQAPEALRRAASVIERARGQRVDASTLERAKARVLTEEFFAKQSLDDRATGMALDELYGLGGDAGERFLSAVQGLSAEDLQAAARRYLVNPVTVVITHRPIDAPSLAPRPEEEPAGAR